MQIKLEGDELDAFNAIAAQLESQENTPSDIQMTEEERRQFELMSSPDIFTGEEYRKPDDPALMSIVDPEGTPLKRPNRFVSGFIPFPNLEYDRDAIDREWRRKDAVDNSNDALYNSIGEPSVVPGIRNQRAERSIENEDGTTETVKENYIVPREGSGSASRGVIGGVLEAGRLLGETAEGVTDWLGVTDSETDYVKENFPRMPTAGEGEELTQEITSMVVGGLAGGALGAKLAAAGLSKAATKAVMRYVDVTRRDNPQNFARSVEMFMKAMIIGRSASVGAATTTPEGVDPLIGDNIVEFFGFEPEENHWLSHYAENEGFATFITVGAFAGKHAWKAMKSRGFGTGAPKSVAAQEMATAFGYLTTLDDGLKGADPVVIADRARILGEVVRSNKEMAVGVLSDVPLTVETTTAIRLGSREYVNRAYAYMSNYGTPEWEKWAAAKAADMAERAIGIKKGATSGLSATQDTQLNANISRILRENADNRATQAVSGQRGVELGARVIEPVNAARSTRDAAKQGLDDASRDASRVQQNVTPTRMAGQRVSDDPLNSGLQDIKAVQEAVGPGQFNSWKRSYDEYNTAFKNLPEDVSLNTERLIDSLETLRLQTSGDTSFSDLMNQAGTDPFIRRLKKIMPEGGDREAIMQNLIQEGTSLKEVYNNWIPQISRHVERLMQTGGDPGPLINLRKEIYDMAEETGNPAFRDATYLYEQHVSTFRRVPELRQYEDAAKLAVPGKIIDEPRGIFRGQEEAQRIAFQNFQDALTDTSGTKIPALLEIMRVFNPEGGEALVNQAVLGRALEGVSRAIAGGTPVNADMLTESFRPFIVALDQIGDEGQRTITMVEEAVEALRSAERGVMSADDALATAQRAYTSVLDDAKSSAFSQFVNTLEGVPVGIAPEDMRTAVFRPMFNDMQSTGRVRTLLNEIDAIPDEGMRGLVKEGLQAEYLNFLDDKLFTHSRMGVDPTSKGANVGLQSAYEISSKEMDKIAGYSNDQTLSTLREVFRETPEVSRDLEALFRIIDINVSNRATKGSNFGSDTASNLELQQTVNRMIMLTMGVLNPAATKARALSSGIITGMESGAQEAMKSVLQNAINDPQTFSNILRRLEKDQSGETLKGYIDFFISKGQRQLTQSVPRAVDSKRNDTSPDPVRTQMRDMGLGVP